MGRYKSKSESTKEEREREKRGAKGVTEGERSAEMAKRS